MVAELEKELARAIKERDELARDVEALCMQSGSSIFDGSMVLSERIFQAEKELSKLRDQVISPLLLSMPALRRASHLHRDCVWSTLPQGICR